MENSRKENDEPDEEELDFEPSSPIGETFEKPGNICGSLLGSTWHPGSSGNESDVSFKSRLLIDESLSNNPTPDLGSNLAISLSMNQTGEISADTTSKMCKGSPTLSSNLLKTLNSRYTSSPGEKITSGSDMEDEFGNDELDYEPFSPEVDTFTETCVENFHLEHSSDSEDSLQSLLSNCESGSVSSSQTDFGGNLSSSVPRIPTPETRPENSFVVTSNDHNSGCVVQSLIFPLLRDFYKSGPRTVAENKRYTPLYTYWENLSGSQCTGNGQAKGPYVNPKPPVQLGSAQYCSNTARISKLKNSEDQQYRVLRDDVWGSEDSGNSNEKPQTSFSLFRATKTTNGCNSNLFPRRHSSEHDSPIACSSHSTGVLNGKKSFGSTSSLDIFRPAGRHCNDTLEKHFSVKSSDNNGYQLSISDGEGSSEEFIDKESPVYSDFDILDSTSTVDLAPTNVIEPPADSNTQNTDDISHCENENRERISSDVMILNRELLPSVEPMYTEDIQLSPTRMDVSDDEEERQPRFLRTVINDQ